MERACRFIAHRGQRNDRQSKSIRRTHHPLEIRPGLFEFLMTPAGDAMRIA
jgi:hypothetical protein